MLIIMQKGASRAQLDAVLDKLAAHGLAGHEIPGDGRVGVGVTGSAAVIDPGPFEFLDGVSACIAISDPFTLVSRQVKPEDTVLSIGGATIGGGPLTIMAGPCAVEGREQVLATAAHVKACGATILRGGAYKPRTSPYSFQGLKSEGLELLKEARAETGLPIITEVKDVPTLEAVAEVADILQIGARNVQNYSLLEAVGELRVPVMLKRGLATRVEEWLMCAEYIASRGNMQIALCERGIRTFETVTRNTLDLGVLPSLREMTHLPIVVDPSHGTGRSKSVTPLALAAVAAGADAIMLEVHPDPLRALSDGPQALTFDMFETATQQLRKVAAALDRGVDTFDS